MPLYEYACDACGQHFELIRKFSDPPVETCYLCGGGPVRKLLSSPAIQFKGTGWYVTDYGRKGQSAPPDGTSTKSSDAKTDTSSGATKTDKPSSSD
jgi:putative FmdB family regulatory protein